MVPFDYEVDRATFEGFTDDPTCAHAFVARARNRELDHLLLLPPGTVAAYPG